MAFIRLKHILPTGEKFDAPINLDAVIRAGHKDPKKPDGPSFICFTDGAVIEVEEPLDKVWKQLSTGGM